MSDAGQRPPLAGLTQAEVAQRVREGRVNVNADVPTKTVPQIVAEHALTLFNGVMVVLAVLVLLTGRVTNMLFVIPVVANLVIGAFQEIRAKRAIDELSVLAARPVRVIRDGLESSIPVEEVVVDDLVKLGRGDQVPADGVVVAGEASVNESLITGESVPIAKVAGSELVSGSFLDAGAVVCRVERVGADAYAARINAGAKQRRRTRSEIVDSLDAVIRLVTLFLAPLGVLLYARTVATGTPVVDAVLTTVSAIVGMIPQGLVLLISSVFALAATRLAARSVLVQQLYSIESFARVDVLCLDKTGTITSGAMEVIGTAPAEGCSEAEVDAALVALIAAAGEDLNDTSLAIRTYVRERRLRSEQIARTVAFSSATKRSGCVTASGRAYLMGAAQFVLDEVPDAVEARLRSFGEMARVLVVASCDGFDADGAAQGSPRLMGYVALQDTIRNTAEDTVRFFVERGVTLNVISGDDPATVSAIARRVGIPGAERYVDASTLRTPVELRRAVEEHRVFGRVTPDQKRSLVRAFRYAGHTVAMMGDGVNDVLALREADCSVAVASGSDVARNVADLVLVDDDFGHMPEIVSQGRQSINNLQRSAVLFIVKTVYTMLLTLLCTLWPPYPFMPIQSTLISVAVIGVPSVLLAVEPNHERIRGRFLVSVLSRALPASFGIVAGIVPVLLLTRLFGVSDAQASTICMYVVAAVGYALIATVSFPYTPLRVFVLALVAGIMVFGCSTLAGLFEVAALGAGQVLVAALGCCAGIACYACLFRRVTKDSAEDGPIGHLAAWLGGSHGSGRIRRAAGWLSDALGRVLRNRRGR